MSDQPRSPLTLTMEQDSKLLELLRPFFPAPMADAFVRVVDADAKLRTSTGDERKQDEESQNRAVQAFLNLYEPWIRKLSGKEVTLSLTAGEKPFKCEEDCTIYVPYERDGTIPQEADNTTPLLSPEFQRIQSTINRLLAARITRPLTLVEEKQLRSMLRAVMPRSLENLDTEVRDLSSIVRSTQLQGRELVDYMRLAERWSFEYNEWVDDFAKKGVRLKKFVSGDPRPLPSTSNVMYLEIEDHTRIVDDSTETTPLPKHIEHREDMLNEFLRGERSFDSSEKRYYQNYLRAFWKTHSEHLVQERLQLFTQRWNLGLGWREGSSRFHAAFLALKRNSFSAFMNRLSRWRPPLKLKFVEVRPEDFRLEPLSGGEERRLNDTLNNDDGLALLTTPAFQEFLELAIKLHRIHSAQAQAPLSEDEQVRVRTLLQPLSFTEIDEMDLGIKVLLEINATDETLNAAQEAMLHSLYSKQLWNVWGSMNPEVRDSVLETVRQPDPIEILLEPMLPGATHPALVDLDPPTIDDVVELETTMNDLLLKRRNGIHSGLDAQKTWWLFRPLSPAHLRTYTVRLNTSSGRPQRRAWTRMRR